ncbi:MAG: acetyl-CoA carboxylase biotin carboxyl carrier protein [Spirochaetales bacterium]|nr:acetyl-CoA carboxylase biotin carboxyl carrier protein [Spirochaetales bacterium]
MDMKDVFALIEAFDTSTLSKLKLSQGEVKISLQKGFEPAIQGTPLYSHAPAYAPPFGMASPGPVAQGTPIEPAALGEAKKTPDTEVITAPIVGTFYRTPSPDSPSFVEEGSKVTSGDILCIIEAMKIMNQLEADFDMEVVTILVPNGTMVEYGAPLFEVRRI